MTHADATRPVGFERPPGAVFLLVTFVAVIFALEAESRRAFSPAIWSWLGIFAAWLVRLVFLAAPRSRAHSHWRLRWSLPIIILAVAGGLIAVDAPVRLRFEASRPAFDALAAEMIAGGSPDRDRVGLYDIEELERTGDGIRFLVADGGFINRFGFVFDPTDRPTDLDHIYTPLGGGWYAWTVVF